MNGHRSAPDLKKLAATQLAAELQGLGVGSTLAIETSSGLCVTGLCLTLERLIPALLRMEYPEWERESIDGFFLASATKTAPRTAELTGTCILISDQTVTPFALTLGLTDSTVFQIINIKLGESGAGPLGISGPVCTSPDAGELLRGLGARIDRIEWVYEVDAN